MNKNKIKKILEKYNIEYKTNDIDRFEINKVFFDKANSKRFAVIKHIVYLVNFFEFTGWAIEYTFCDMDMPLSIVYGSSCDSKCESFGDSFNEELLSSIISCQF